MYQQALDYAKCISERIYQTMQSVSKVATFVFLPCWLKEGAEAAIQQAKRVYITLKQNNVPSELPSFLLYIPDQWSCGDPDQLLSSAWWVHQYGSEGQ